VVPVVADLRARISNLFRLPPGVSKFIFFTYLFLQLGACTSPESPWIPAQEPNDARQSWKKAGKGISKQNWLYLETQFVEWGVLPPPSSPNPWLSGSSGFEVKPRQTPWQREKDDDPAQQAQPDLQRRFHYIYTRTPKMKGNYRLFQIGSFSQADGVWNSQMQKQRPMRLRCENKEPRGLEVSVGPNSYGPVVVDQGFDGSEMGAADLQETLLKLLPWLCRNTFK